MRLRENETFPKVVKVEKEGSHQKNSTGTFTNGPRDGVVVVKINL